jgi:hypothetical protein
MIVANLAMMTAVLASGAAQAGAIPGLSGHAYSPSQAGCFFPPSSWAGVSNHCSTAAGFILPIQNNATTTAAQTAIYVNVSAPGITCTGYQVRPWGSIVTSHSSNPNVTGRSFVGYFFNVTPTDTLHLVCNLPPANSMLDPRLYSVEW